MEKRVQLILTFCIAFVLLGGAEFSTADEGLMGHWKFNEGIDDTAYDYSGNGNHAKIEGAEWIDGVCGTALYFDGIDDCLDATDFGIGDTFTLSLWIDPFDTLDQQCFIGKHCSSGANRLLFMFADGGYCVNIRDREHIAGEKTDKLQHLAVVGERINPSRTKVTVYKNGFELWQSDIDNIMGDVSGLPWTFGQDWDAGPIRSAFFHGMMDEVRIYNRALSEDEVRALYHNPCGDLVAFWKFDEGFGDSTYDYSGNGNHAKIEGAEWIDGVCETGLYFDGIDDCVDATDFDIQDTFSLTLWVSPTDASDQQCFIGKHSSYGDNRVLFMFADGGYCFVIRDNQHIAGTKIAGMQHLAVVAQRTGSSTTDVVVYRDGEELWHHGVNSVVGDVSGLGWTIGQDWDAGPVRSAFFHGIIDEVRIYNRALSGDEIRLRGRRNFIRADANANMEVQMSDAIFVLQHLYVPGSEDPPCMDAADANDNGAVRMSDAIYILKYLYVPGAPPPPAPFPSCGPDGTQDDIGCCWDPCQGAKVSSSEPTVDGEMTFGNAILRDRKVIVPVYLQNNRSLAGLSYTISYDPELLDFKAADNTELVTEDFEFFSARPDQTAGCVSVGSVVDMELKKALVSGYYKVARLIFELKNHEFEETVLEFNDVELVDTHVRSLGARTNTCTLRGPLRALKIFALKGACPNPFAGEAVIRYQLPRESHVSLRMYNVSGQFVKTLIDERQKPGYYGIGWDGRDDAGTEVASGVYFCRMEAGKFTSMKKIILLR